MSDANLSLIRHAMTALGGFGVLSFISSYLGVTTDQLNGLVEAGLTVIGTLGVIWSQVFHRTK